jgi:ERCC4-related helicase
MFEISCFLSLVSSHPLPIRFYMNYRTDEAHRATGEYAYNHIVRFLMAKNPHHRVLALTATPGSNPEAVQQLINGLHISRIEIRNEDSLDIKPYIYNKASALSCSLCIP